MRAHLGVIARLDAIVPHLTDVLGAMGDDSGEDERRVKAVLLLTDPVHALELLAAYRVWKDRPADPPMPVDPDDVRAPAAPADPLCGPAAGDEPVLTEEETVGESAATRAGRTGPEPQVDWRRLLPTVQLFVHLYAGEMTRHGLAPVDAPGLARVEGHGPVTEDWLRTRLGPLAAFTVRPVLDPLGQAPVDAYEIPDRHRRAVRLLTPADTFPFANSTDPGMQVDHTVAWEDGGRSEVGNYGPMTTFHHRVKTHAAGWRVAQPFPGIYVWRDPQGVHYLVDHTGTRRLPGSDEAA